MTWKIKIAQLLLFNAVFMFALCGYVHSQSKFAAADWMKKDMNLKVGLLQEFTTEAKRNGINIRLSPEYYLKELDNFIVSSPRSDDQRRLQTSVRIMVHTTAAMEGD